MSNSDEDEPAGFLGWDPGTGSPILREPATSDTGGDNGGEESPESFEEWIIVTAGNDKTSVSTSLFVSHFGIHCRILSLSFLDQLGFNTNS